VLVPKTTLAIKSCHKMQMATLFGKNKVDRSPIGVTIII